MPKKYSDAQYAAALNAWSGNKPPTVKDSVPLEEGSLLYVPIGRFMENLRNQGRRRELEPVLVEALEARGLTPQREDGMWKLPPSANPRIRWSDKEYADALNAWSGNKPPTGKNSVPLEEGSLLYVPIGTFMDKLRNRGRRRELEPVLVEALEARGLTPQREDGMWKLPPSANPIIRWSDKEYADALNAWSGNKPPTGQDSVPLGEGSLLYVPIGRLLKDLRNQGRRRELEPVLVKALQKHGLSPALRDGMWKIGAAVADADGSGRFHGEAQFPQTASRTDPSVNYPSAVEYRETGFDPSVPVSSGHLGFGYPPRPDVAPTDYYSGAIGNNYDASAIYNPYQGPGGSALADTYSALPSNPYSHYSAAPAFTTQQPVNTANPYTGMDEIDKFLNGDYEKSGTTHQPINPLSHAVSAYTPPLRPSQPSTQTPDARSAAPTHRPPQPRRRGR